MNRDTMLRLMRAARLEVEKLEQDLARSKATKLAIALLLRDKANQPDYVFTDAEITSARYAILFDARVSELEAEGLSTSDAQGVAEVELRQK